MNHCELPAISVIAFAIQPPVQDSAVANPSRRSNKRRPTRAASRARSRSECIASRQSRNLSTSFCGNNIQADRNPTQLRIAGVIEHTEALNPVDMRKPRETQEMPQELLIQANQMVVVLVDVAAEYHPHDEKAVFDGERLAVEEQAREDIEIRHAHVEDTGGNQHSIPPGPRRHDPFAVVKAFDHMGSINSLECMVGEYA